MSVSITNTLPTSTANTSLSIDPTRNAEPLAVRGCYFSEEKKNMLFFFFFLFIVMRLSKPALYQNIPIYAEEESSSSAAAFLTGQSHDIGIGPDHSVLSQLLVLPYSFGFVDNLTLI
jgi:hypothetical protein